MTRKTWQSIFRIAVAVMTLWIISLHVGRLHDIIQSLLAARLFPVAAAFFLMIVNIFLQYSKWKYILHLYYPELARLQILGSILVGLTLGIITPGRLGELGRGFYLRHVNKWHVIGLTLIDKMFNNLAIFIAGSIALYYFFKYPFDLPIFVLAPYTMFVVILSFIFYRLLSKPQTIYRFLLQWEARIPFFRKLDPIIKSLENFHPRQVRIVLGYSFLIYLIIFLQFLLLVQAFSNYSILPTLLAIMAALFSKILLPVSIGDLGIREGAAVYFMQHVNILKVHAFNASLLLFAINILLPSMIGGLLIPRLSLFNNNHKKQKDQEKMTTSEVQEHA